MALEGSPGAQGCGGVLWPGGAPGVQSFTGCHGALHTSGLPGVHYLLVEVLEVLDFAGDQGVHCHEGYPGVHWGGDIPEVPLENTPGRLPETFPAAPYLAEIPCPINCPSPPLRTLPRVLIAIVHLAGCPAVLSVDCLEARLGSIPVALTHAGSPAGALHHGDCPAAQGPSGLTGAPHYRGFLVAHLSTPSPGVPVHADFPGVLCHPGGCPRVLQVTCSQGAQSFAVIPRVL